MLRSQQLQSFLTLVFGITFAISAQAGTVAGSGGAELVSFGDTPNSTYPYRIEFSLDSLLSLSRIELVYTVDGGAEQTVEVAPDSLHFGAAVAEIPPQSAGSRIEYYLRYTESGGASHVYPDSAPAVKPGFRITSAPASPENLLLALQEGSAAGSMLLYDTGEQRIVGKINGHGGRIAGWSRDGTLALVLDLIASTVSLVDVLNFRLCWVVRLEDRFFGQSAPVLTPDNSYAFVPVIKQSGEGFSLMRLDLRDGTFLAASGFSEKVYLTSQPVLVPASGNVAICGSDRAEGDITRSGYLFIVEPGANAVVRSEKLGRTFYSSLRTDSLGGRFYFFGGNSVRVVSLDPLKTEFEQRFHCYTDSSVGGGPESGVEPELVVSADKAGVIAYQNTAHACKAFAGVIYWDTGDRLAPLHEIDLSQYYAGFTPWFTASHDNSQLWFFLPNWRSGQPSLLPYSLQTRAFLEPFALSGLAGSGEDLGFFCAYQRPAVLTTVLRGDASADGRLDVFDLLELLKALKAGTQPNELLPGQDVNVDGKLDVFDLLGLLKLLAH